MLTILHHADLWGVDATSEKFGVDTLTLKRWQEREPSGWQREEEVNRLLMMAKRASGKVHYRDAVVGAGIATDRNREARPLRAGPPQGLEVGYFTGLKIA